MNSWFTVVGFVFLSFVFYNQSVSAQSIKAGKWINNTVLTAGSEEINFKLDARFKKDWDRHVFVKSLVINDSPYEIIKKNGAINIIDQYGFTVLKTDRYRSIVLSANNEIFRRSKMNRFTRKYELADSEGEVVVSGRILNKEIHVRIHQPLANFKNLMAALCFIEMSDMMRDHHNARVSNIVYLASFAI